MTGGISLKPSDATAGGGLLDEANVTLESCRSAMWDYNGTIPTPVVALQVTYQPDDTGEGLPSKVVQYYSAGDSKNFVPSEDGRKFVPVSTATGINENSNCMFFLTALVNAGFPEDKLGDDLSVFDGMRAFVKRVPGPKRAGFAPTGGQGKGDGKILVVQKVLSLPGEGGQAVAGKKQPIKKAASPAMPTPQVASSMGSTQSQGGPASATSAGNGGTVDHAKAVAGMMAILLAKGGQITMAQVAQDAFKHFAKEPDRNQLVQYVYSPAFLGHEGAPWEFDGTTVKLGE